MTMKKISTLAELTAAALTAGLAIENLRSQVTGAVAGVTAFTTKPDGSAADSFGFWVRDLVAPPHEVGESWCAIISAADGKLYEQDFTIAEGKVTLAGDPREVVQTVEYAPAPSADAGTGGDEAKPVESAAPETKTFALEAAGEMLGEAPDAADKFEKGFCVMAGGVRTVTLGCMGQPLTVTVKVGPESAKKLQAQLEAVNGSGKQRVFNCFDHGGTKGQTAASSWPKSFFWNAEKNAIYETAEPSARGLEAVSGKVYRGFSLTFFTDAEITANDEGDWEIKPGKRGSPQNPANIIVPADVRLNPGAYLNMGTMTNKPAFSANEPLFAATPTEPRPGTAEKNLPAPVVPGRPAGALPIKASSTSKAKHMNEQPLDAAALQARNTQLEQRIAQLEAEDTAIAKAQLEAARAELEKNKVSLQLAAAQEKTKALEAAEVKRKEKEADQAVAIGLEAQAIPMLDKEAQKLWRDKFTADPTLIPLMTAQWQAGKPAGRTRTPNAASVAVLGYGDIKMGAKPVLEAMSQLLARQKPFGNSLDATACEKRSIVARDLAVIYRNEVRSKVMELDAEGQARPGINPDFLMAPLEAATDADNLGTLAGTLVSMRYLDIFMYKLPILSRIMTDFSDQPSDLNQVTSTRKIIVPGVIGYDPTLDADGYPKGWVPVAAPQSTDVNITLDELIGSPIQYDLATLSSTQRQLFMEQAPAAAYANALYFMKKIYAVCTAANFNAYAAVTAADANGIVKVPIAYPTYAVGLIDFSRGKMAEIAAAFDSNEVPDEDRSLLLNSQYYNKATTDPSITTFFAGQQAPEIITQGRLPNLAGFVPIKAPNFPGTNNRQGLALQKNGLLAKSRLPNNLNQVLPGAGNGSVTQIVHPETGVAMLLVQWVDHKRGYSAWLPCAILGAAKGDVRGGLVITNQ